MPPPYDRPAVGPRIVARLLAGESLRAICADPAMPSEQTVANWARANAPFAAELEDARRRGAWRRTWAFDEARAKEILARLAAGERIASVLADPRMPTWKTYRYWRATQGHFAEAVGLLNDRTDAARAARIRKALRPWDQALADRILVRVAAGTPLPQVLRSDPGLPGRRSLARWRAQRPDYDRDLRTAMLVAHRRRRRAAVALTPELTQAIFARLVEGASLAGLSREPGMPHRETLYRWARTDPGFADWLDHALDSRAEWLLDLQLEIAEDATPATRAAAARRIAALKRKLARLDARPRRADRP